MYRIHFFNDQGKYQVPIYREDVKATLEIVFTYKNLVPGIRVTQSDEVVFETEFGRVVWPEIEQDQLAEVERAFPPAPKASALDALPVYMAAIDRARDADLGSREPAFNQLRSAEVPLLAYAASEGLNLNHYAYRQAEEIIYEISEQQ